MSKQIIAGKGFSLIEILVVIGIIGLLAGIVLVSLGQGTAKARDTKRKAEISQFGRILSATSCYLPDGGAGSYDLADLMPELEIKYPQLSQWMSSVPKDPRGSDSETRYVYVVNGSGQCALHANLEREEESVTLPSLTAPTPGGGIGVLEAATSGVNGSKKYFQVSS